MDNTAENVTPIQPDNSEIPIASIKIGDAKLADADSLVTLDLVAAYVVDSDDMFQLAADEVATIKGKLKRLEEMRVSITRPLDEAKKQVMDLFRGPKERYLDAEKQIKASMVAWSDEQDRIRAEAQRKADEEIRRQQAEADRIARETQARLADEQAEREAAAIAKADALAAEGKQAEAEAAIADAEQTAKAAEEVVVAVPVAAPTVYVPAATKAAGISKRKTYKGEVTNMELLVKAIAAGKAPLGLVKIDQSKLNALAKSLEDELNHIPGVRAVSTSSISSRSK